MCDSKPQLSHISTQLDDLRCKVEAVVSKVHDHDQQLDALERLWSQHESDSAERMLRIGTALWGPETGRIGEDRGAIGMLDRIILEQARAQKRQAVMLAWLQWGVAPLAVFVIGAIIVSLIVPGVQGG
jgi:hypothetical protein